MKIKQKSYVVDLLFTLALFGVLSVTALMVVVLGADVYKKTVNSMSNNFSSRTSLSYISEKIRQNDRQGDISFSETKDGSKAILIETKFGDSSYQTWIYSSDGKLKEVMVPSGTIISDSDGMPIMDITSFVAFDDDGMLLLKTVDIEGNAKEIRLARRCK